MLKLLDQEKIALAFIHSGPRYLHEVPDRMQYDRAYWALLLQSLGRFGLVDVGWDFHDWVYSINEKGAIAFNATRAYMYRCCDDAIRLECICSEKTFCPNHDGGCHGTHD